MHTEYEVRKASDAYAWINVPGCSLRVQIPEQVTRNDIVFIMAQCAITLRQIGVGYDELLRFCYDAPLNDGVDRFVAFLQDYRFEVFRISSHRLPPSRRG